MSRYIDVEEVTRTIVKRAVESTMDLNTIGDIINIVQDFPTADVVEVAHGEWIMLNPSLAKCSACGGYESTNGKDKTGKGVIFKMQKKFCPHCGAKMDLR